MRWYGRSGALLQAALLVVAVFSVVYVYRSARKDPPPLILTPQELERSTGKLGEETLTERNGQLGEDQDGPVQRKGRRRVMALSYREQLNSALKYEMFSLATLAADLGASVVEPFVVNSRMYGCQELVPALDRPHVHTALPLSSVADVRTPIRNCAGVHTEPLQALRRDSPRKVVLVYAQTRKIRFHSRELNVPLHLQSQLTAALRSHNTGVLQCTDLFLSESKDVLTVVEKGLSHLMSPPSKQIDQVVCFNASKVILSSDLLLELPDDEDLLIVFSSWRGCYIFDCSQENYQRYTHTGKLIGKLNYKRRPNEDRFKIITDHSLTNYQQCTESPVPHSALVSALASEYLKDVVKLHTRYVSVHVRTEIIANTATKLGGEESEVQGLVSCVLQSLNDTVSSLLQHNPSHRVLLCTDAGDYGTDSLGALGHSIAKHMLAIMTKSFGWTLIHFNPTSLGLSKSINSGLVSFVEMNMLMRGDYLVVAGHGNFQQQLISHFLQRRNASAVYRIIDRVSSCRAQRL